MDAWQRHLLDFLESSRQRHTTSDGNVAHEKVAGVVSYIISIFVKHHRQSYRGAVNESIRRR